MTTLGDYLNNPFGKTIGVPINMVRAQVTQEINQYYPRIDFEMYATKDKQLVILCHLPSKTKKGFTYDVVLQLDLTEAESSRLGIQRFPLRVFSNSPSFYYTFAQSFKEQDMFCTWLQRKYDRKVMRKASKTRNPNKQVSYERTVYTCAWYVSQQLRGKPAIDIYNEAIITTYKDLFNQVTSQDDLEYARDLAEDTDEVIRKKEEAAARKAEREAKKAARSPKAPAAHASSTTMKTGKTQTTNRTSKTQKTGKSSKTRKI